MIASRLMPTVPGSNHFFLLDRRRPGEKDFCFVPRYLGERLGERLGDCFFFACDRVSILLTLGEGFFVPLV